MTLYRYSRWDGAQDLSSIDEDDLLEQVSAQLMAHGDLAAAMRSVVQQGVMGKSGQRMPGVMDLLQRLRSLRQQNMERYNLSSVLANISQRLQDIIDTERAGIQQRVREVSSRLDSPGGELPREMGAGLLRKLEQQAQRSQEFLDQLPPDPAGRLGQLNQYEFMSPEARAKFEEMVKSLQQQVLDSHVRELSQRLQQMGAQDVQGLKEMVRDLNRMLEQHLRGDTSSDFEKFLQEHGSLLGTEPPSRLEELVDRMRRQMAAMQDLLRSMSPGQRQELQQIMDAALQDPELQEELGWLNANLDALFGGSAGGREYRFHGQDSLTLEEALDVMDRLEKATEVAQQLRRIQQGASIDDVDSQLLEELLGQEASRQLEQLKGLAKVLEEAGYIRQVGDRYELTPRGVRRIGQKALLEIFALIRKDRTGTHAVGRLGNQGELQREGTKRYEFGDAFDPDLQRTLMNAVLRGEGVPVRMRGEDFEVYRTTEESQASTVLMVDLSLSMAMRGNFLAAKKVALALDNLIRTQFPRDVLHVVGFSTYAREVKPDKLPYLTWDELDPYTNIQHGLALSRKLLSRTPGGTTRQIIMISDGEPTAHMEAGQMFLQYPPSQRTIRETLLEVKRCTSMDIIINTFMLDRNSHLMEFVDQMTRINRGRVFYTNPERLGQYILVDYFGSRRRVLG
ncbi:MAG: VWA domain-containing protein [Dehalococcoidia bacterium]|nr:VWA domain-containing protein [Dehalococcoidia bacterium]